MNKQNSLRDTWCLLGLPFDMVNLYGAVNIINKSIENDEHCFLTTPNLNFVVQAQSDDSFFNSVVDSDLSVADGMPLIWVARILGIPLTERVAGSALFDELSKQEGRVNKIKVFFFGGQAGVAEQAHQKLNETSLAMESCGFYDPGFVSVDEMSSPDILEQINIANPDFIVVALGAKKGQAWIQKNKRQLKAPVISHLGAVINFVAGNVERAPIFWQRFGLEWLWRIKQEPTLWRRYWFDGLAFIKLVVIKVLPLAIYDRVLRRSSCFQVSCSIHLGLQNNNIITLGGSIHNDVLEPIKHDFVSVIDERKGDVVIDCTSLEYIDGAFIATLLLFQRYLKEQDRVLYLQFVPARISRILSLSGILKRFALI